MVQPQGPRDRVTVIHGPGVHFDRERLHRRLRAVGDLADRPMDVAFVECPDEAGLRAALAAVAGDDAVIVDPGTLVSRPAVVDAALALVDDLPVVWVELRPTATPPDPRLVPHRIHGRGIEGYLHALTWVAARLAWPRRLVRYGEGASQFGVLRLPEHHRARAVVALLHGGGWRDIWGHDRTEAVAVDLARRGYATWNIEFSRIGPGRTTWTSTFEDVAASLDHVRELGAQLGLDTGNTVVVGHSSGGHLALWAGARGRLPAEAPGAAPRVRPRLVVSLAGCGDIVEFARRRLDFDSAYQLVGGSPDGAPQRYAVTSPLELLPLGTPQLLVHGLQDGAQDLNDLARIYRDAALAAGDTVELLELERTGHPDLVDPRSEAWQRVVAELEERLAPVG